MKLLKGIMLACMLAGSSASAFSATLVSDQVLGLGTLTLPSSLTYGQTFSSSSGATTGDVFFDAFHFTIPSGTANSITTSIDLGSILGLSNLRARIYAGSTNDTLGLITSNVEGWSTAVNAGIPGVTLETVVLNPVNLLAGAYTLQIRGTVAGTAGGAYAGVLNITNPLPVPEPETYAMFLAGLGLMGSIARRRKIS